MLTSIIFIVVTLYVVAFICSSETIESILGLALGLALVVAILAFAFNRSTESGFVSISVLTILLGIAIFFDLLEKRRQKLNAAEEELA